MFPTEIDRGSVLAALSRLTHDHRQVLLECHFHGLSVAEAATRLGLPASSVRSRVYYALRAFRLALDELGADRSA